VGSSPALGAIMNCEVRASLAGYRSDSIGANRHSSDNPDLGVIVLHRAGAARICTVSAATLAAPRPAVEAYHKAMKSRRTGNTPGAKKSLERAVALYPDYAEAWMELGFMIGREHDWAESARCLDRGVKLNPADFPQAWFADAMAQYYMGEFEPAERSAREAVRLDSGRRNPRAGYVLGMILAQKRDFKGAAEEMRSYLQRAPNAPDIGQVKAQLAEIESRQLGAK
jgi:tetratricopeptide (TPR) repeat protein